MSKKAFTIEQFDAKSAEANINNFKTREAEKEKDRLNLYDISDILESIQQDTNEGKMSTEYLYPVTEQFDPEDFFGKVNKLQQKGFAVHLGAKDKDTLFIVIITRTGNR